MSNIIEFSQVKREPYVRDEAICPVCSRTWIAVVPQSSQHVLTCPDCGSMQGVWLRSLRAVENKKILTCSVCSCQTYYITEDSRVCCKCGKESYD